MSRTGRKSLPHKNWSILQTLLNETPTKKIKTFFSQRRPTSIRIKSQSRSPQKYRSKRGQSFSRVQFLSFSKAKEELSCADLGNLFQAKCTDLEIPVFNTQKQRFFFNSNRFFHNRKFDMKDSGLALKSAICISKTIKKNPDFAYLILSKNALGDKGGLKVAKAVKKSLSLVYLDLSSNSLTPMGVSKILKELKGHESLVNLDLSSHQGFRRNRLAEEGAKAVAELLSSNQVLSMVNLEGTSIGPKGLMIIIEGILKSKGIVEINLANNSLGSGAILQFSIVVSKSQLYGLNLGGNELGNQACECIDSLLRGAFTRIPVLQRLDLSRNNISTQGLYQIFDGLRYNNMLRELNFSENLLSRGLPQNLGEVLKENAYLKVLDLTKCGLKFEGFSQFQQGLAVNRCLEKLLMSKNLISDKAIEFLAFGLAKNQALKVLDLSYNKIRDKGGLALGQALKFNSSIEAILMRQNYLKDQSGSIFSQISRYKHNLQKVSLEYNLMNLKYLKDINHNLEYNQKVKLQNLVPQLTAVVKKLKIDKSAFHIIHLQQKLKQKEKQIQLKKYGRKISEYNKLKKTETSKMSALQLQLQQIQSVRVQLAEDLQQIEIDMKMTQKRSDRIIEEIGNNIAHVVYDIRKLEKQSKIYIEVLKKEEFMMKRLELNKELEAMQAELEKAEVGQRSLQQTLHQMIKKLENMKNPTFLDSENQNEVLFFDY